MFFSFQPCPVGVLRGQEGDPEHQPSDRTPPKTATTYQTQGIDIKLESIT